MKYSRYEKSVLLRPQISFGLWHNFGSVDSFKNDENIVKALFNQGITHFYLANNYGLIPSSTEINFGKIVKNNFQGNLREEIEITTKAHDTMWDDPCSD
jgi:L-glyceraldehyde 3-phosphate reductase